MNTDRKIRKLKKQVRVDKRRGLKRLQEKLEMRPNNKI